jgi:hypothetical protein
VRRRLLWQIDQKTAAPLPSKYAQSQSPPFPSLAFRFGGSIFIDCAEFIVRATTLVLPFSLHTTHPNLCVRAAQKETYR